MKRTHAGYTMNVTETEGGYNVVITTPTGGKIYDFAFSVAHAWKLLHRHAI